MIGLECTSSLTELGVSLIYCRYSIESLGRLLRCPKFRSAYLFLEELEGVDRRESAHVLIFARFEHNDLLRIRSLTDVDQAIVEDLVGLALSDLRGGEMG